MQGQASEPIGQSSPDSPDSLAASEPVPVPVPSPTTARSLPPQPDSEAAVRVRPPSIKDKQVSRCTTRASIGHPRDSQTDGHTDAVESGRPFERVDDADASHGLHEPPRIAETRLAAMATPTETLDVLLDAWRSSKDPALAALIGRYCAASESAAAQALRNSPKQPQAKWLAALADGALMDRGALLLGLAEAPSGQVAARIDALAELDGDPRVVDTLHALIEAVPWTSTGARKVWTRTFKLLQTLADPRTIVLARAFDPSRIQVMSETAAPWMAERLTKLADALEQLPAPKPVSAKVQALMKTLERRVEATHESADPLPELLLASMAAPDDLDARMVLADALTDRGDPRGELIRVQKSPARPTTTASSPVAKSS